MQLALAISTVLTDNVFAQNIDLFVALIKGTDSEMATVLPVSSLDDFYRFLLSTPTIQQIFEYQRRLTFLARMSDLVARRQQNMITVDEDAELDTLIQAVDLLTSSFEHLFHKLMKNYPTLGRLSRRELRRMLKTADLTVFDETLLFLLDDPLTMRAGYMKQLMWKYVKRYNLNADQLATLEAAALNYLKRRMTPEFTYMCQTMARIAPSAFWAKIEQASQSDDPQIRLNASCLLPYARGVGVGEQFRQNGGSEHRHKRWAAERANASILPTMADLIALLHTPEFWENSQIVSQTPKPSDLPIVYYDSVYDLEVAALDYRYCRAELLIPKLRELLFSDYEQWRLKEMWLHIIFILKRVGTPVAVNTLIEFMEKRIDYKFESVSKSIVSNAVYSALSYIGIPEALQAISVRQQIKLSQSEVTKELLTPPEITSPF